jgi:hypothetical protein
LRGLIVVPEKRVGQEQISRKWTMQIKNWKAALQQFAILYKDRLPFEALGVTKA